MMRTIDGDYLEQIFLDECKRLIECLKNCDDSAEKDYIHSFLPTVEWARRTVHVTPTINTQPVVYCKNCCHGENYCDKDGFCTFCYIDGIGGQPRRREQNWFCADGEEREDDEV